MVKEKNPPPQRESAMNTHIMKPSSNMLQTHTVYSFTYNPNNDRQYYKVIADKHLDRIATVHNYVRKLLSKLHFEYILQMEISTPMQSIKDGKTMRPRIHFHGFIYFLDDYQLYQWYNRDFLELSDNGYVDIDTCDDISYYYSYAQKNDTIMRCMLQTNKLHAGLTPFICSLKSGKLQKAIKHADIQKVINDTDDAIRRFP